MAAELVSQGKGAYDADMCLRLAGEAIMHRIGEAAGRIPDSVKDDNPHIPFRTIKAMRNPVAHNCERVGHEALRSTMMINVPNLMQQIDLLRGQPAAVADDRPPN